MHLKILGWKLYVFDVKSYLASLPVITRERHSGAVEARVRCHSEPRTLTIDHAQAEVEISLRPGAQGQHDGVGEEMNASHGRDADLSRVPDGRNV